MTLSDRLHDVPLRTQAFVLRAALGLPAPVQRLLAGPPVVDDGQTLAVDTQLMLRLQRLIREPGAETLPVPEGRLRMLRQAQVAGGRLPVGDVRDLTVAGLPARLYTPSSAASVVEPTPLVVFFHGGGFMYGDLDSHDAPCRFLAERSRVRVLAVDYRLGPEDPFPAAYDDAVAAYRWTVDHAAELGGDPQRLAVAGDSAGGNLAAGVAIHAAGEGLPLAFQLLVYPSTDAAHDFPSAKLFDEGFYLTRTFLDLAGECYVGGADLQDPRLSPLYADLPAGVAPALVVTAGFDPLRDEGEAYAQKLAEAGVQVELRCFAGQIHGFFNVLGAGRTNRAATAEIAAKLRAALAELG